MLLWVLEHLFLADCLYLFTKPRPLLLPTENSSICADLQADGLVFGWLFHLAGEEEDLANAIRSFSVI